MQPVAAAALPERAVSSTIPAAGAAPVPGAAARTARPILRPLLLPSEHGGWGFLFEPLVLGLAVAPSGAGAMIAIAALFAFLSRQPLKLAMQDALRRKLYSRTIWCRRFAAAYAVAGLMAVASAAAIAGWRVLLPFALVAPLALVTLVADARNRSRAAAAEYCGSIAMSSTAAAIAIAGGWPVPASLVLPALIALRGVPSIAYVRTLLRRAHRQTASSMPALIAAIAAIPVAYLLAGWAAAAATVALLARASWGLFHPPVAAKTLGWREIAWGAVTVGLFAVAIRM